jgi:hypothetical protein
VTRRHPYDWQADEDAALIASWGPEELRQIVNRVRAFFRALADAGLHVGIGTPPRCATCQSPWPCTEARHQP